MKINSAVAAAIAHAHQSPAKMARELLASRPDLEDKPFGQVVSKLARGEGLPTAPQASEPTETAPQTGSIPTAEGINILA